MADRIEGIRGVSYNAPRIEPVRGYTDAERKAKIEAVEKESQERMELLAEKRAYLAKYPTPKGATFTGLLDEAMGKVIPKIPDDDEEGFVLDIGK